ncbi:MAG: ABC transporter ATP-binding protein [Rubrivivax sp.]
MIVARGLAYRYAGGAARAWPDFEAPQGAIVRLAGPSGSGKSTLLALLAGLLASQQGQLAVAGTDLAGLGARSRDAWRARTLGFLPQRLHLSEGLSVARNLALPDLAAGRMPDRARLAQLLERLGLQGLEGRLPGALSGGQAQRVALARALVGRPRVILVDEPTAHLDDEAAAAALALLAEVAAAEGATLVVATHDARVGRAWPDARVWTLRPVAAAPQGMPA